MAVDTQDKRASVLGLGLAALLVLPAPGALDQPDRQQLAYCYRGLQAAAAETADGDIIYVLAADRTVSISAEDRTVVVTAADRTVLPPVRPTP